MKPIRPEPGYCSALTPHTFKSTCHERKERHELLKNQPEKEIMFRPNFTIALPVVLTALTKLKTSIPAISEHIPGPASAIFTGLYVGVCADVIGMLVRGQKSQQRPQDYIA